MLDLVHISSVSSSQYINDMNFKQTNKALDGLK